MTRSTRRMRKSRKATKTDLPKATPSRRSRLIAIRDVQEANKTDGADKYQHPATRLRAFLLLIKQYKLTYWDNSTDTASELTPERLSKSLSNAFGSGVKMSDFWGAADLQAQKALRVDESDIERYEEAESLPAYGTLPFVPSAEQVELELALLSRMGCGSIDIRDNDENTTNKPLSTPIEEYGGSNSSIRVSPSVEELTGNTTHDGSLASIEEARSTSDPSQADQKAGHAAIAKLVVIADIDQAKSDVQRSDYKYKDQPRQKEALRLIIQKFALQTWNTRLRAFVGLTKAQLHKLLTNFCGRKTIWKGNNRSGIIWSEGINAFSRTTIAQLLEEAERLPEGRDPRIFGVLTELSESNKDRIELLSKETRQYGGTTPGDLEEASESSEEPPTKLSRKRKAAKADLLQGSRSLVTRHEHEPNIESMPSWPPSPSSENIATSRNHLSIHRTESLKSHVTSTTEPMDDTIHVSTGEDMVIVPYVQPAVVSEHVDLRKIRSDVEGLSGAIQTAVNSLFSNLNLDVDVRSPIPRAFHVDLPRIFRRCWGPNWETICERLEASRTFSAFHVLKAIVAAFLFEHIFQDDISWQADLFNDLDLALPPVQEFRQAFFDLASTVPERCHEAQDRARIYVAKGLLGTQWPKLQEHAVKLTETFMLLICRYIEMLSRIARDQGPRRPRLDDVESEEEFQTHLALILKDAITLRLRLCHSRHRHRFLWPEPGNTYEPALMESVYPQRELQDQVVGFTLFPSLSIQIGHNENHVKPAETVTIVQELGAMLHVPIVWNQ